jgi:hypothetical protein
MLPWSAAVHNGGYRRVVAVTAAQSGKTDSMLDVIGALVQPHAHDIEHFVRFSHLGPAHHHYPLVGSGMHRPLHGDDVGRDGRVTGPRKP